MKVSLSKRFTLSDAERRFRRACDQIVLLNQKLGEVQKRYKNARRTNNRSFRYNLRLKLAVVEGVRNMYYDYAYAKADQVADLRRELFNESLESFLVQFQTTCLIQNRGSKPHVVSPKNGPSQSQHKYLERKPLNCRSIILVHTHVHYQVLHIFWSQAWRQSSCFESLPTPHPNFHLRMLDPRLLSILLISFWLALLFAQLHLHCTSR